MIIDSETVQAHHSNQMPQTTVLQDDAKARKKFPKLNVENRAGGFYEVQKRINFSFIYFDFYIYVFANHMCMFNPGSLGQLQGAV